MKNDKVIWIIVIIMAILLAKQQGWLFAMTDPTCTGNYHCFNPTADAYVKQSLPTESFSYSEVLKVEYYTEQEQAFIKWEGDIPSGTAISSVHFCLYSEACRYKEGSATARAYDLCGLDWNEDAAPTWNTKPAICSSSDFWGGIPCVNSDWYCREVNPSWVQEHTLNNHFKIGLRLTDDTNGDIDVDFASRETVGTKPYLILEYGGNCNTNADTNCNNCVSLSELTTYIGLWKANPVGIGLQNLMNAIGAWKANPSCP